MISFVKAQFNSLISTAVDFMVVIMLVELFSVWYVAAIVIGAIAGATTNFSIGRTWVFQAEENEVKEQIFKYALVWTGSILLNTGGVYFVTEFFHVKYIVSKIVVSTLVGFTFNYFLQKRFVFSVK